MLLQSTKTLEEIVVLELAKNPGLSAKDLHHRICSTYLKFTQRGVYKKLYQLEAEGVIIKNQNTYSLRFAWIANLLQFADETYDCYLKSSQNLLLPIEGEKITWRFSKLHKLDMVWTQLSLTLLGQSRDKIMYLWFPHAWFYLVESDKEIALNKAMRSLGSNRFISIGNDSYLDRLYEQFVNSPWHFSYARGPFEKEQSTYYTLINDYLITVKLDKKTTELIEELFNQVTSQKELTSHLGAKLFTQLAKATMSIEYKTKKAVQIRNKFELFFGN